MTLQSEADRTEGVPVVLGRPEHGSLSFREARANPCLDCRESPCCTYLLLRDFFLENLLDVDYAHFLLNFDGIYLAVGRDRKVDVYLYQPCGNLDSSGLCGVHSTPDQPAVCIHYNAHACAYKHRMLPDVDDDRPLVDRMRMLWLADQFVFDEHRRLIDGPEWSYVLENFAVMPLQRTPAPPPGPDPVLDEWQEIVLGDRPAPTRSAKRWTDPEVIRPCDGCGAWCCTKLVFNRGLPSTASQVEFLRYCIGFPSVEVGVAEDGWAVIVNTTCRHLEGNQCSVFGQDERPLRCSYYDALNCGYRGHFGQPRPEDMLRVSRTQFAVLADSLVYDELGNVASIPPVPALRNRIEHDLKESATSRTGGADRQLKTLTGSTQE